MDMQVDHRKDSEAFGQLASGALDSELIIHPETTYLKDVWRSFRARKTALVSVVILAVVVLYTLTWLFMFLGQRLNWWYGFLWPLLFLNLIYMASWSWFRTVSGRGFLWKDRVVS